MCHVQCRIWELVKIAVGNKERAFVSFWSFLQVEKHCRYQEQIFLPVEYIKEGGQTSRRWKGKGKEWTAKQEKKEEEIQVPKCKENLQEDWYWGKSQEAKAITDEEK